MVKEKTILIIKPDLVKKKCIGKVISVIEENNIDIDNIIKTNFNIEKAKKFYIEHEKKLFYSDLVNFMTSGPIIVLVLSGFSVIEKVRQLIGNTNYKLALDGTIRKKFATSLTENAVHASDSYISFLKEYKIVFEKDFNNNS